MKKNIIIFGISCIFLLSLFNNISAIKIKNNMTSIFESDLDWDIIVDDDGNTGYTNLQQAVNDAEPYYKILVKSGIYSWAKIDVSHLTIQGEEKNSVFMTGVKFTASANWINFSGFTLQDSDHGIYIDSNHNNFSNNIIKNNKYYGLILSGSYNNVSNNIFENDGWGGVLIKEGNVNVNVFYKNTIIKNSCGLIIDNWEHTIKDNVIQFNGKGIGLRNINKCKFFNNEISGNKVGIGVEYLNAGYDGSWNSFHHNNLRCNKKGPIIRNVWLDDETSSQEWHHNYYDDLFDDSKYVINKNNVDSSPLENPLKLGGNQPPETPTIINCPKIGKIGQEYQISFKSFDEDNDDIYYKVSSQGGSEIIGPYKSGEIARFTLFFEQEPYGFPTDLYWKSTIEAIDEPGLDSLYARFKILYNPIDENTFTRNFYFKQIFEQITFF